jgi:NDP-sugar pyrophosphorylase family protein
MSLPVAILAGGLANRLRPLTEMVPKSLVDVQGDPFIAHQLRLLKGRGISRVIMCVAYRGEMIQDVIGNGARYGVHVEFSFDEPQLLGTAGAIKKALPLLGENFFVLYGDSYLPCDYRKIQTVFEDSGRLALMTVFQNDGRWDRSNAELKSGQILSYDKKNQNPKMRHIDYGLGAFKKAAFQMVPDDQPYDLAKLYQDLLKRNELAAYEVKERFYEVGSFSGLEEFRKYIIAEHIARPEEPQ